MVQELIRVALCVDGEVVKRVLLFEQISEIGVFGANTAMDGVPKCWVTPATTPRFFRRGLQKKFRARDALKARRRSASEKKFFSSYAKKRRLLKLNARKQKSEHPL